MDAHRIAGNERDASAAAERELPSDAGQRGELPARLAAATEMLAGAASADSAVATIGRALLFLTTAEHAAILVRSPNGFVTCPWSHNLSDAYLCELATPKGANPWMHILRHPEITCMDLPKTRRPTSATPWFLPDVLALSSDHDRLIERITGEGLRSVCAWPLTRAGRVTAAFVYCYDSPHVYTQDEQEVMGAFASQAAAALQDPGASLFHAQSAMNAWANSHLPTDSQTAVGPKIAGPAPKHGIDASRPLVVDTHRATEDEHGSGAIEAARVEPSKAPQQLGAEQTRLTADRTSLETDSGRFAQAQATLTAKSEQFAEARQAPTLEPDQSAEAQGNLEAERAQEGRSTAARPSRWRQATLVASIVIAAHAAVILWIGSEHHRPAVSTMEHKPAPQVPATAVQQHPLSMPHHAIRAGVVPSVAKAVVTPTTSRPPQPPKAAYVVVVGTFESSGAAEEVKRLVQGKGYVVHVVLEGTVSKVMTAPMQTRAQAEGVARGLEAVGFQAQVTIWREQRHPSAK